jgi:hypothetical protein
MPRLGRYWVCCMWVGGSEGQKFGPGARRAVRRDMDAMRRNAVELNGRIAGRGLEQPATMARRAVGQAALGSCTGCGEASHSSFTTQVDLYCKLHDSADSGQRTARHAAVCTALLRRAEAQKCSVSTRIPGSDLLIGHAASRVSIAVHWRCALSHRSQACVRNMLVT